MPALTTTYNFSKPLGPDLFLSGHIVALGANWDELDDLLSGAMALELRVGATFTINDSVPSALFTLAEATGLAVFTGAIRFNRAGTLIESIDAEAMLFIAADAAARETLVLAPSALGVAASAGLRIAQTGGGDLLTFIADAITHSFRGSGFTRMTLATATGQLAVTATGPGAGILLGGDAGFYRSAANFVAVFDGDTLRVGQATPGDDFVLQQFVTSRSWDIRTAGVDGGGQGLAFRSSNSGKLFHIESPDGTDAFAVNVDDTDGNQYTDAINELRVSGTQISDASGNLQSANGVAAFGPAAPASITIVNGIVTAIA